MFDLKDKVVLVTGAANGIGAAIVRECIKEDAKFISILDNDEEAGRALEAELARKYGQDKVKFMKCDVTNDDQLAAAYKTTYDLNGYIDVVVNNAGIGDDGLDAYKKEIEINFTAVVTSSLKALTLMRRDKGGKGGTIVNVSSVIALALSSPSVFIYGATKAAVLHFTTNLGKEGYSSRTNVRTLTICFGATDTDLIKDVQSFDEELTKEMKTIIKYEPLQTAEDAARGFVEAYKDGESGSIWLIWCKVQNITGRVNEAYKIMADNIFD